MTLDEFVELYRSGKGMCMSDKKKAGLASPSAELLNASSEPPAEDQSAEAKEARETKPVKDLSELIDALEQLLVKDDPT